MLRRNSGRVGKLLSLSQILLDAIVAAFGQAEVMGITVCAPYSWAWPKRISSSF